MDGVRWVVLFALVTGCGGRVVPERRVANDYPTLARDDDPIDPYRETAKAETWAGIEESSGTVGGEYQVGQRIRVDVDFGDPRFVEAMELKVMAPERLPSEPNHAVRRELGGVQRVTVKVGPGAKVTAEERAEALQATGAIDTKTAAIRDAAKRAIAGVKGERRRVARLVEWVYANVRYEIGDEPIASKVVERGHGDCSEKALVFVAMARAVGIPARQVSGLAGTYDEGPAFGFHAWAQVAIDGRWVQVDPTWNETVADATHVMLGVGDGDEWTRVVDGLTLTVVSVTKRPGAVYESDLAGLARELPMHLRVRR